MDVHETHLAVVRDERSVTFPFVRFVPKYYHPLEKAARAGGYVIIPDIKNYD